MELLIYLAVFAVVAYGLVALGGAYVRAGPAGLFGGMFRAPTLGWPVGVQEEDRDRVWSWAPPGAEPDDADVIDLGGSTVEPTPVRRVRG
jgi:hypothetical protein